MTTINIGTDFSDTPAGRYYADGPWTGQFFREKWLWPALEKHQNVRVEFDDAEGYGSSFLEEAFGGIVRYELLSKGDLLARLTLVSSDEALVEEVLGYINEAVPGEREPRG